MGERERERERGGGGVVSFLAQFHVKNNEIQGAAVCSPW